MAYIGNEPVIGQWRKLDDISGSFNGSLTSFTTQVGGTNVTAGSANQLLVSLGGVLQEPGTDYSVSSSTITFTTAPAASLSFFAVLAGDALNTSVPADGSITTAKLGANLTVDLGLGSAASPSLTFDADTGLFSGGDNQVNVSTSGVERAEFGASEVVFNDGGEDYDFRVEGDTNANLLFVDASTDRVGVGTSSPIFTADILSGTANTGANVNNPSQLSVTGPNKTLTGGGATVFVNSNSDLAVDTGGSIALSGRNTTSSTNSTVWGVIKGAKENATSTNTAGYLAFATTSHSAGSLVEALRIDSSGRVIIGQTDTTGVDGEADDLIVANNTTHAGITIRSGSSHNASVYFADQEAVRQGRIEYNHTDNYMRFNTDGSERIRILDTGGITFNGDTAAANALDDYEEGTWTPTLNFGNATTGIAYAVQKGTYTKIGNVVRFVVDIQLSSKGTATGNATITGLPFSISNTNGTSAATGMSTITTDAKGDLLMLLASGSTAQLRGQNSNSDYTDAAFGASTIIRFTGTYQVS